MEEEFDIDLAALAQQQAQIVSCVLLIVLSQFCFVQIECHHLRIARSHHRKSTMILARTTCRNQNPSTWSYRKRQMRCAVVQEFSNLLSTSGLTLLIASVDAYKPLANHPATTRRAESSDDAPHALPHGKPSIEWLLSPQK